MYGVSTRLPADQTRVAKVALRVLASGVLFLPNGAKRRAGGSDDVALANSKPPGRVQKRFEIYFPSHVCVRGSPCEECRPARLWRLRSQPGVHRAGAASAAVAVAAASAASRAAVSDAVSEALSETWVDVPSEEYGYDECAGPRGFLVAGCGRRVSKTGRQEILWHHDGCDGADS